MKPIKEKQAMQLLPKRVYQAALTSFNLSCAMPFLICTTMNNSFSLQMLFYFTSGHQKKGEHE